MDCWPIRELDRYQRISNPSILTVPVIACFSLCDNRIDYLEPPIATGNSGWFPVIGGE
jgi:hypothetical protein